MCVCVCVCVCVFSVCVCVCNQKGTGDHDRGRRKSLLPPIGPSRDRNHKQNKTTIWFRRGPKENTTTQRLFHPRNLSQPGIISPGHFT